jgi:hypothetical protein
MQLDSTIGLSRSSTVRSGAKSETRSCPRWSSRRDLHGLTISASPVSSSVAIRPGPQHPTCRAPASTPPTASSAAPKSLQDARRLPTKWSTTRAHSRSRAGRQEVRAHHQDAEGQRPVAGVWRRDSGRMKAAGQVADRSGVTSAQDTSAGRLSACRCWGCGVLGGNVKGHPYWGGP